MGVGDTALMRASRHIDHKPAVRFSTIVQVAIVIAGVVAVGLLVAAHPTIGIALIVGVLLLVLAFGRSPVVTKDESRVASVCADDGESRPECPGDGSATRCR